ncbi:MULTISPECIES: hypothetical protein [Methylosinus]|uniref:Phage-Barnase-EndoU-ColicinE5/D-RelE like nuclease 3 domain-containing protein n=1 Tax=Methylosinus trichosporium (strain ATCC 35070 / NCIMB 11131 / UNIQEM 75 / OB3b) TaxID=595536 RepID=A0A2D2CY25_METT3|nr:MULTISPECIES: hypothetical protein [Methylosinus]ATQ67638.1 hypothetical protein CQW49_06855 [Methylosinus trichosporium OB3b]
MKKKHAAKIPDLILGPLPVEMINRVLGYELDPGDVILSRGAQIHASRRHPDEYPVIQPHVSAVVTAPLYVGDDINNHGKIELVGRIVAAGAIILVAVNIEPDARGRYHIASFYRISEQKVQSRREKGHLKRAV